MDFIHQFLSYKSFWYKRLSKFNSQSKSTYCCFWPTNNIFIAKI